MPTHTRTTCRHATCCAKSLHTRKHDRIRDLLTKLARQAGLTAIQIMPDGQPAPGSVRPIHRADVHIIEPQGSEFWLDVRLLTVGAELSVAKNFSEKNTKRRAYGQREGYNLQALDKGVTPVVLEQYGRTAPGHEPSSTGSSIIVSGSSSDRECPSRMPRGSPSPSSRGALSPARCSEQLGRHTRSAPRNSARPILCTLHQTCRALPGRHSD